MPVFLSGGAGLTRAQWEREHGNASDAVNGYAEYEGGRYTVAFLQDRLWYVGRTWRAGERVSLDTARVEAGQLLPEDARLLDRSTPRQDRVLEVYSSNSLTQEFPTGPGDPWRGTRRGLVSVVYRTENGDVSSMTIQIGGVAPED